MRTIPIGDLPKSLPPAAFEVPDHEMLYLQVPSPRVGYVLVLERQLYGWTIFEYDTPLTRGRQWTYGDDDYGNSKNSLVVSIASLIAYIDPPGPDLNPPEPKNWIRAIDFVDGVTRVRRSRNEADGTTTIYDTSDEEL